MMNKDPSIADWFYNEYATGFMSKSFTTVESDTCVTNVYNGYGMDRAAKKFDFFFNGDGKTSAQGSPIYQGVLRTLQACSWRQFAPDAYTKALPVLQKVGGAQVAEQLCARRRPDP